MVDPAAQFVVLYRRTVAPNLRRFARERHLQVWLIAAVIGLTCGAAAVLFRHAIGAVQWIWLQDLSENVITAAAAQPWWVVLAAPTAGGLVVGLMLKYLMPGMRAGTVADVIEARTATGERLRFREGMASAAVTAVSLGAGASAGREGPVVHLGATVASKISHRFNLPDQAHRVLMGCGVAAAVSASFNAPIAGVLFAQEVILAHYATTTFVPLVLASVSATIVSRLAFGSVAAFTVPEYQITSFLEVPAFVLLGVVAAVVAILFQLSLMWADRVAQDTPIPQILRPVAGGFAVGLIALAFPHVLGVGYQATDAALKQELPLLLMLALIVAKTAATAITLASRFGGGVFSPALYLGAMTGGAFGLIAAAAFPDMASSEGLYAILGMGAVAAAVLGAPISTTVIVFELTGGFALSMALLLTVSIANGLSLAVLGRSWFHNLLALRGIAVYQGPHKLVVRMRRVSEFMIRTDGDPIRRDPAADSPALRTWDTLEKALAMFEEGHVERVPVIGDDPAVVLGWACRVDALALYNRDLIATSEEEHH